MLPDAVQEYLEANRHTILPPTGEPPCVFLCGRIYQSKWNLQGLPTRETAAVTSASRARLLGHVQQYQTKMKAYPAKLPLEMSHWLQQYMKDKKDVEPCLSLKKCCHVERLRMCPKTAGREVGVVGALKRHRNYECAQKWTVVTSMSKSCGSWGIGYSSLGKVQWLLIFLKTRVEFLSESCGISHMLKSGDRHLSVHGCLTNILSCIIYKCLHITGCQITNTENRPVLESL